jgi:hypothetical protein
MLPPSAFCAATQRLLRVVLLAACLTPVTLSARDDIQAWQNLALTWLDTEAVDLTTSLHFRITDDISTLSHWRLGQEVKVDPLAWLSVGAALRRSESKNSAGAWRYQHRAELELNPHWRLGERIRLNLRNRLEVQQRQGSSDLSERLRHRLRLSFQTSKTATLRELYAENEVLHRFDRGMITENRAVPLGLNLRLPAGAGLRTYYMLRSVRGSTTWRHEHIVGSSLSLSL